MLLSRLMRTVAVTGRTDSIDSARVNAFFGGRQGGRWAKQTVAGAFPNTARGPSRTDPAETRRQLTELHQDGVVTDAEFERLRAQIRQAP
jgi:hypothetical protein